MSRSYRNIIFALGLIVFATGSLAQEAVDPGLESEPVITPTEQHNNTGSEQNSTTEQQSTSDLLSTLQGIESAIRDLIAEEDKIERQRQSQREMSDLAAQQDMALWAERMFWATCAAVFLTLIGIILIWQTLSYTRRASKHTREMLNEANHATDIAREDLQLSRPPRFKLTRPIVYKTDKKPEDRENLPEFDPGEKFKGRAFLTNYGRYDATIKPFGAEENPQKLAADCYFLFAKGGIVPMSEAYDRHIAPDREKADIEHVNGEPDLPVIRSGGFAYWDIEATVPADFKKQGNGEWSHKLYIIGHVQYLGALEDSRGVFFCKRYLPNEQRFEDAKEYEHEDIP